MFPQKTIKIPVHLSGIGVHTGKTVNLTLHPAPENTGIIFRRVDVDPAVIIPASTEFVSDTRLNTCLSKENISISTVEHVLSALSGLEIDNAYIDVDNCEPPIMDGSAQAFVQLIQTAGIIEQNAQKKWLRIKREIKVEDGDKFASLSPFDGFKINMTIVFDHPVIAQTEQSISVILSPEVFANDISDARTFGFLSEYDYLKQNNLGLGASLENTLVLDDTKMINEGGLRHNAEFVKHKILDVIGDLRLLGYNLLGEFTGYKTGHALNHRLRQALLADPTAWELVTK